mmetsp:Transcript_42743/g.135809  ORF Transcript_42743/g.135809 Transcript_42743/m.135809 type:complete len:210 (-) Transcript_42743:1281-1910(-)
MASRACSIQPARSSMMKAIWPSAAISQAPSAPSTARGMGCSRCFARLGPAPAPALQPSASPRRSTATPPAATTGNSNSSLQAGCRRLASGRVRCEARRLPRLVCSRTLTMAKTSLRAAAAPAAAAAPLGSGRSEAESSCTRQTPASREGAPQAERLVATRTREGEPSGPQTCSPTPAARSGRALASFSSASSRTPAVPRSMLSPRAESS